MKGKLKMRLLTILSVIVLSSSSCMKDCKKDSTTPSACSETPITDGITCEAVFKSWIYDKDKNECLEMTYSGCGPIGFETESDCNKCKCK